MVKAPATLPPGSTTGEVESKKIIAPACTLKLVSKKSPPESTAPAENTIPKGSHWVDLTEPGTVVVIDQPEGQKCAAVGGIMAQRMKARGVAACVIGGRFRDLAELRETQLPVCILVFFLLVMSDVVISNICLWISYDHSFEMAADMLRYMLWGNQLLGRTPRRRSSLATFLYQ